MGKEYKLVELTEEEQNNAPLGCIKCVAIGDGVLCFEIAKECLKTRTSYYIEVEKDDK